MTERLDRLREQLFDMLTPLATPFIRAAFKVAAGWFGAKGVLEPDQQTAFVDMGVSAALLGISFGWTWLAERRAAQNQTALIKVAVQQPPDATVEQVKEVAKGEGVLQPPL